MTRGLVIAGAALAMIYSPAFDALPAVTRGALYARMRQILANRDDREIMEILDDTRGGWR